MNVFDLQEGKKLKLAKELSDMVIYCKSVHFNGFQDAKDNLGFYEMSSFKERKAMALAEESGESVNCEAEGAVESTFFILLKRLATVPITTYRHLSQKMFSKYRECYFIHHERRSVYPPFFLPLRHCCEGFYLYVTAVKVSTSTSLL